MKFDFWKLRLTINYYKGIKKVCFTVDFEFFNDIPINATQTVFFTVVMIYFWVASLVLSAKAIGK